MRKRSWVINLLLLASACGSGWKLRHDWKSYAAQNGPQAIGLRPFHGVAGPPAVSTQDYGVIVQQNPFYPDRNDAVVQPEQAKPVGPPPLIYGSVIIGKEHFALLGTEETPKPQKVTEGQTFNGYRVSQVLPQSVVLESAAGRSEIMLYNAMARLRREYTRTQTPAAGGGAAAVRSTGPAAAPPTPQAAAAAAPAASQPAPPQTATPPPGKKLYQTPFGAIVIDDKRP